jgi:hypothetical protein
MFPINPDAVDGYRPIVSRGARWRRNNGPVLPDAPVTKDASVG